MGVKIYRIGADEVRVTVFRNKREAGEIPRKNLVSDEGKRDDNIGRAKRVVYDLIKCNKWDYFCTQTVDAALLNRGDLDGLVAKMSRGVADQNKRVIHAEKKIRYVWVPELHQDGAAWHLHGVLSGLTPKDLRRNKNGFLEWSWSAERVGFFSLSRIRSAEKTATYVRKYMTKNVEAGGYEKGAHLYYRSKGLQGPTELALCNPLDENDLVAWLRYSPAFAVCGEFADTFTLQGEALAAFRGFWGERVGEPPRVTEGSPQNKEPILAFF